MISLPQNCRVGKISVFPKNWETKKANINSVWYVSYWFFDDNLGKKRRKIIKGMNRFSTLHEKQNFVREAIENEKELLLKKGMNEISKTYLPDTGEISPHTTFITALEYSLKTHHGDPDTKIDIRCSLKYITQAAKTLGYDRLPIGEVRKKHIKFILDEMANIKTYTNKKGKEVPKVWNDRMFNHTRANLSLLFGPLVEIDAVELNPVAGIKKRTKLKKIREVLSLKERTSVKTLKENFYPFFRFIQIFFHSGVRIKELLRVRKKDVNIDLQHYKITVKKGGRYEEVIRIIKTIALPYWKEILDLGTNDQILFSRKLLPGPDPIRRDQLTRRWQVHVKDKLGIIADLYSLKHSNLEEIAAKIGIDQAQEAAGHQSKVITMGYAQGEAGRERNRLKTMDNEF